jgi:transposase
MTAALAMASFRSRGQVRRGATDQEANGPYSICSNCFVRWRQAAIWNQIMAIAAAQDGAVKMIDTSVVRVHQRGACITGDREQHTGRSRGGLTSRPLSCQVENL